MNNNAFEKYHPVVNFAFFIGAIVLGMFSVHPAFLVVSAISSITYYLLLTKGQKLKFIISMFFIFILFCIINAFINSQGSTVLFTYFNNRTFTLEALCYGMAAGTIFISVLFWFACYNIVMTDDKFTYLFGRVIPSVSLILTMVLRLVPTYKKKAETISGARRCIGKGVSDDKTVKTHEKLTNSIDILSSLFSWALEGAVITADSMKSRGYGQGRRSSFVIYNGKKRDYIVGGILLCCVVVVLTCFAGGSANAEYFPSILISSIDAGTVVGLIAYAAFLFLPSVLYVWEDALWHISKSKI